jgi:hypothetical protein
MNIMSNQVETSVGVIPATVLAKSPFELQMTRFSLDILKNARMALHNHNSLPFSSILRDSGLQSNFFKIFNDHGVKTVSAVDNPNVRVLGTFFLKNLAVKHTGQMMQGLQEGFIFNQGLSNPKYSHKTFFIELTLAADLYSTIEFNFHYTIKKTVDSYNNEVKVILGLLERLSSKLNHLAPLIKAKDNNRNEIED